MKPSHLLKAVRARTIGARKIDWAARPPEEAWRAAIDGEVGFWVDYLATKGERYPGTYEVRLDPNLPLQPEYVELIHAEDGATVRLLDVGAGPLTFLGRVSDRWTLEITAVDALGAQYARILDDAGVVPPVRTQTCESEKLTDLLPADSFDLVGARNTLDHSYDPVLAISQMVAVAKPGAPLVLKHHRNEAEREHYHGMHQWNFEASEDALSIWRPGQRTDIVEALAGAATFERTWIDRSWEIVVLRKS